MSGNHEIGREDEFDAAVVRPCGIWENFVMRPNKYVLEFRAASSLAVMSVSLGVFKVALPLHPARLDC